MFGYLCNVLFDGINSFSVLWLVLTIIDINMQLYKAIKKKVFLFNGRNGLIHQKKFYNILSKYVIKQTILEKPS